VSLTIAVKQRNLDLLEVRSESSSIYRWLSGKIRSSERPKERTIWTIPQLVTNEEACCPTRGNHWKNSQLVEQISHHVILTNLFRV
jgi:hypothetical protein